MNKINRPYQVYLQVGIILVICGVFVFVRTFGMINFSIQIQRYNDKFTNNYIEYNDKKYVVWGQEDQRVAEIIINEPGNMEIDNQGNIINTYIAVIDTTKNQQSSYSFYFWPSESGSIFCCTQKWNKGKDNTYGKLKETHVVEVDLETGKYIRVFSLGKNELFLAVQGDFIFLFGKGEYYARNMNDLSKKIELDTLSVNWFVLDIHKEVKFYISDDGIDVLHKRLSYELPSAETYQHR